MLPLTDEQIVRQIAAWFEDEIVNPLQKLEDQGDPLYSETEEAVLDALNAPIISGLAASGMAKTHNLTPGDPSVRFTIARAAILYAFLYGRGKIDPRPFPLTADQLYQRETQRAMAKNHNGPIL